MRALLVMVAIATAACQASSAGWAYPQDRTSSLTDAASLYEGAADVFGQEIDVAFQPHLAAGPTPLRSAIRAYYEAGAAATWRFATTIAIIRGDPDLNAAVARVAALGSTEAALQRLALAAPDPGASLADLYRGCARCWASHRPVTMSATSSDQHCQTIPCEATAQPLGGLVP